MAKTSDHSSPAMTAVVTGGHGFDVPAFHRLFRGLDGIDAYVQGLDDFCAAGKTRADYDVVVFYNMHKADPDDDGPWYVGKQKTVLAALGDTPQGIVLLHHAILAFPDWPTWGQLTGLDFKTFQTYDHDVALRIRVADENHPITAGLADWDMIDETYTMAGPDLDDASHILLTTDHPKSMPALAWTRQHHQARVFCLQSGHDAQTYANANFRTVLRRGILWVAGRI